MDDKYNSSHEHDELEKAQQEALRAQAENPEAEEFSEEPESSHAVDVAEHIESLSLEDQVRTLSSMPVDEAADALAELDEEDAGLVLEMLPAEVASAIVARMDPDDAADVLDELEDDHLDAVLGKLDHEEAEELRRLMAFDPDTAGGIMNTDIILLHEELTIDEAILQIRHEMADKETPYYGYVVDKQEHLLGVMSLRDIMLSPPGKHLSDCLADQDVITVRFDVEKQEVARLLSRYNFMAIPVVDQEARLLGIVTYDDVLDIIEEEASSDMLGMVGAGQDESVYTPWGHSLKMRLPWLFINMINSTLSAFVVFLFEGSIAQMAILAVLMPMVANQAGNTGQQALAVMIRQLAVERFDHRKAWAAVLREGKIGFVAGAFMSVFACLGVVFLFDNVALGMIMGLALICDMLLGAISGGSIPLVLRALGRDPAQASSIFLTTITDGAGFFIFLGLATVFLL